MSGANSRRSGRHTQWLQSDMVSLADYADREQAYVKHVLLEGYLERLVHKVASSYDEVAYVDGFAGLTYVCRVDV